MSYNQFGSDVADQDPLDYVDYTTVQESESGRPWTMLWTLVGPLVFLSLWKLVRPAASLTASMSALLIFMIAGYMFVGTIEKLKGHSGRVP